MMMEEESYFDLKELFFSRTDLRGVILSGNSVFQRVSVFNWEELIGAPHSCIRHPDMPRGVFYLLWETILAGNPIGAYVKNRSKDKKYYWVFALVLPVKKRQSFVSIRLKPTSAIFDIVQEQYKKIKEQEILEKLTPQHSSLIIKQVISSLGFKDYQEFMIKALMEELKSRQEKLEIPPMPLLSCLEKIDECGKRIEEFSLVMLEKFKQAELLPLNLAIQSSQLKSGAGPLSAVSTEYASFITEFKEKFEKFIGLLKLMSVSILQCKSSVSSQILLSEVIYFFKKQAIDPNDPNDYVGEMQILQDILKEETLKMNVELDSVTKNAKELRSSCLKLDSSSAALEVIRLVGKIEIAKLEETSAHLVHLTEALLAFKTFFTDTIGQIVRESTLLEGNGQRMKDL